MSWAMSQHSNPHPYAITTTATGLLSRSSSTHSASAAHRFVPASPSRHSANELPRPLPVPPPSPPTLYRARDRRADTLPSASQPDLFGGHRIDDLPADPRSWSPSDLSTYLSSALRATSAGLSPLAAHDLAAFVRSHGISGKKFLRLADGDLDSYGLNQRGLDALLRASRVLRQNSIRGRIWNTGEDDANTSSSSSLDGKSALLPSHPICVAVRRGRTQSGSGRVKGMIASFERSASPTKSSSSASSISSVKNPSDDTRHRPQGDGYHMDSEAKREPRLLPYPPSPASTHQAPFGHGPPPLLPQDTSSGVLSFSPQSTASLFMLQTPPPPQSFSDVFYTDPGVNARPLPFPPHSAQYYPSPPPTLLSAFDQDGVQEGMPLPRGMMVSDPGEHIRSSTFSAPHVRIDQEHAVHNHSTIPSPPPRSMADSVPVSNEILAPRPHRHASEREAPNATKMLEEKLEELLEPRPRSRIGVVSHGSVSRPRSRVASMNGSWGRKHANGTPGIQKRESDGSMKSGLVADDEHGDDGQQQQQRVRVISVSSRSHSHRLSGVEVWGETHPHYHRHHHSLKKRLGIPFGEGDGGGDEHDVLVADERLEDEVGKDGNGNSSEDEEIGNIESVLEKSEIGGAAVGVGVEDGVAVAKEPKSAVITVLEIPPDPVSEVGNEEEEESMEALLEREEVSGADAWEMIGEVDTVKRVSSGLGKGGVGDVFSSANGGDSSSLGVGETTDSASPVKKLEEEKETKCDQKEEEERELEKRVRETREMVEDARRRLENVEMWMERYEGRLEKRGGDRRDDSGSGRNDGTVMRVLRGFSTLFGFGSYYPRANTTTTTTQANGNGGGGRRATGRGRVVRLGIGLSSCVVLFGIGVCMVLLRLLGRRPVAGFGLGRMVGHWVVLNAGGGGRR